MKKVLSLFIIGILCISMLSILTPRAKADVGNETTLFTEDFESHAVGTFPSAGGWELVWNGMGDQYQVITDAYCVSPTKSLQLWGDPNDWSAVVQKHFSSTSRFLGYEVSMMVSAVGYGGPGRSDYVGFFCKEAYVWGKHYAAILFNHDTMNILADDNNVVGTWTPGVWYNIKVLLDRNTNTYSAWIDGQLKGTSFHTPNTDTNLIDAVQLQSDHPGVKDYFDDVRVFEASSATAGLIAHWKFDEGSGTVAHDSSGNGNDGTVVDASWANGISTGALQFDGTDDYVGVSSSPSVCVTSSQITVQVWMKPTVTLDATTPITNILDKGDEYGFQMDQTSSGRIWFFVWLTQAPWQGTQTTTNHWEADTWYHLTGTYDGNDLKVYVNGVLENSRALSGDLYTSSFPLSIGSYCLGTKNFFNGAIDEVKIYNYARTVEQIQADYNSASGPVGYWRFDEGSGSVAFDSSGNNYDGAVNGAAWITGVSNGALYFDGSDYVAVPDNPSLSGFTQLTLEAWIKADRFDSYLKGIVNKGNGGGYFGDEYGLQLNYDRIRLILSAGDPTGWIVVADTDPVISLNQWYHVAGAWDSSHYYIYVNGELAHSSQTIVSGAVTHDTSNSLNIGSIGAGSWPFNGAIDEVKIYNHARTAEDIWADYAQYEGLVAHWTLDEGLGNIASDSSGNGNTGTVNGAAWVDGIKGKALEFDGINDFVSIPHSSSLDIAGNEISVEYWMKLPSGWYADSGSYDQILYDKGDAYTACMVAANGRHRFNIPYLPPYPETNKNAWDADVWYHIADVFDGSQIRIYVNGVLDKTETVVGPVSRSGLDLAIGSHCFGDSNFFNGHLDDFAIYNYARTAEEIQNDYDSVSPPVGQKPVAILHLDDTVHNIGADVWFYGDQSYDPDGGKITSYIFDFDDQTPNVQVYWPQIGTTHQYSAAGEYYTRMKVIDDEGMESDWVSVQLTILPAPGFPTAVLTVSPNPQKVGESVTFDASQSSDPDGISDYGFEFGDGTPIMWTSNPTATHSYSQVGEYYARVRVSDTTGLETWSTKEKVVIISEMPQSDFEISVSPSSKMVGKAESTTYEVSITSKNGYAGTVYLAASSTPNGDMTFNFLPSSVTISNGATGLSTLAISTKYSVVGKDYTITIAATDGGETKISTAVLSVVEINGIETTLTLNSFNCLQQVFSVQQNFWLFGGSHLYWVQNIVLADLDPPRMAGLFEIYNWTSGANGARIVKWYDYYGSGLQKSTVIMRSIIQGNQLALANDFSGMTWQIPSEIAGSCHIVGSVTKELPGYFLEGGFEPEIVLVGSASIGPLTGVADFLPITKGHVDTYLRIGNTGIWLYGHNSVINSPEKSATVETASGLQWWTSGNFEYASGFADEGLKFTPDYSSNAVNPPIAPQSEGSSITALMIYAQCPVSLSIHDSRGRHDGFNESTGKVDFDIPGTLYCHTESMEFVLVDDPSGTYDVAVLGTGTGEYVLTIEYVTSAQTLKRVFGGTIFPQEAQYYSAQISETEQITAISWEYVFKDTRRGTMLKISTDDKYFQFIAPNKDFGIKHNPKMIVYRNTVIICYSDKEMCIAAIATTGQRPKYVATVLDKSTRRIYLLISSSCR